MMWGPSLGRPAISQPFCACVFPSWSAPSSGGESAKSAPSNDRDSITISKVRLDQLLRAEVAHLATVPMQPISISEILAIREPRELVKLIQSEVPKRYAMRLRMIEGLSGWQTVPQLKELHSMLKHWYQLLALADVTKLSEFTAHINGIRDGEKTALSARSTVLSVASGTRLLRKQAGGEHEDEFLDRWIDGFLLLRIGSNMILDQYRCIVPKKYGGRLEMLDGLVDKKCNATAVCESSARVAQKICQQELGNAPEFSIDTFVHGEEGTQPASSSTFSYIPGYLRYIVTELMKNSFTATVKNTKTDDEPPKVRIIVCCDRHRVAIRVSDRGGGIPFDVGDQIWSYLFGVAAGSGENATNLGGYGVGLPLSRLHAVYLRGKLHITTYPGHGTDAHLLLPRIEADQVESMPLDRW